MYLFQPNVSFWNAVFSKRNIYQNQLINFPFFLLDRTFHVTLRGDMQLYHLMAAPGAFLSFWCFFFCFVFEPDHHICYYVDLTFFYLRIQKSVDKLIYFFENVDVISWRTRITEKAKKQTENTEWA